MAIKIRDLAKQNAIEIIYFYLSNLYENQGGSTVNNVLLYYADDAKWVKECVTKMLEHTYFEYDLERFFYFIDNDTYQSVSGLHGDIYVIISEVDNKAKLSTVKLFLDVMQPKAVLDVNQEPKDILVKKDNGIYIAEKQFDKLSQNKFRKNK